jgi:hypothetical protein
MDTLHSVLRSIRGETKARRDHLEVFREFLDHLDRASRHKNPSPTTSCAYLYYGSGSYFAHRVDYASTKAHFRTGTKGAVSS